MVYKVNRTWVLHGAEGVGDGNGTGYTEGMHASGKWRGGSEER